MQEPHPHFDEPSEAVTRVIITVEASYSTWSSTGQTFNEKGLCCFVFQSGGLLADFYLG